MTEISFSEIKQALGDLYLEMWTAKRDLERMRESSAHLLEATRSQVQPDDDATEQGEAGPTPLPSNRARRREG